MATASTSTSNGYTFTLTVTETGTNVAGNYSTLSYSLTLSSGPYNRFSQFGVGASVSINGKVVANRDRYSSPQLSIGYNDTITLLSGTTTVTHNSDGTLTGMPISASLDMAKYNYTPGPLSVSNTMNLTPIAVNVVIGVRAASGKSEYASSLSGGGTYQKGSSVTISATPVNGAYFNRWIDVNGDTISSDNPYTFTATQSITYYAALYGNSYSITYNANGGSNAPSPTTWTWAPSGSTTLTSNEPTRTGYTFLGWAESSSATSAEYQPGASWSLKNYKSYTFYAVWKANTYTISYNANGGSNAPSSQTKTHGVTLKLTNSTSSRASVSAGSYTVTLNGNGGTVSTESLIANRTTNYTFDSWNTNASGTGTKYYPGGSYTTNASDILYAIWTSSTVTNSVSLPAPNNREGYICTGWSTSSSGSVQYKIGSQYTPSSNITLYAVWTEISENTIVDSYNNQYRITATPIDDNYSFSGWYRDNETLLGKDNPYVVTLGDSSIWNTDSTTANITARFTRNTLPVSYASDGEDSYNATGPDSIDISSGSLNTTLSVQITPINGYAISIAYARVKSKTGANLTTAVVSPSLSSQLIDNNYNISFNVSYNGDLNNVSEIEVSAITYYYPRLNRGKEEYLVSYIDDEGTATDVIPYTYSASEGKWIPGIGV